MHKRQTWPILTILALSWFAYAAVASIGSGWLGDGISPLIAWVAFAILALCPRRSLHYVMSWRYIAASLLFWAIAETIWGIDALALGIDPETNAMLLCLYLLPGVSLLFAVVDIAFHERRRWMSIQFLVDITATFIALCAFVYFAFFRSRIGIFTNIDLRRIAALIGLTIDMFLVTFAISLFLSLTVRKIPAFLVFLFTGMILYAVADILYAYALFNDMYASNEFVDVVYSLSIVLIGSGGALFLDCPSNPLTIRAEVDSSIGMINRSLFLLLIPALALIARRITVADIAFFVIVIFGHQLLSRLIRQLIRRDLALEDRDREAKHLEATIADRTRELRIMNQTLENLLKRDAITGLFNRKFFMETVEAWVASADAGEKIWLLIIDFDRFKTINDTYGHDVGDAVLRVIAKRLEGIANDRTVLARLGGDEFGVICRRRKAESITELIHTIGDMADEPVPVGLSTVHTSVSIGIAAWPDDALTRSDLMRHADIAMYIAKRRKVNGVSFFDTSLIAGIERTHQIDLALKTVDFEREFSLVYQPQFAMGGRRLVGMEALVRWKSPALGDVPPDEFIPIAEENGVINSLSEWIFRKALLRIADWNRRFERRLLMGINVSPQQLDDPAFLTKLVAFMEDCGAVPEWVNLEFTERVAMKGEAFMIEIFAELNRLNITSSIDDFGTGYSSLSYLMRFEIDYLKIAKQLVDNIVQSESDELVVQAIIMMATALKLRTIAEGVETEEQLALLERLGCDEIQGYLLGKPYPAEEFEERFLKEDEPELL
ncbi:MAG TPA: bifunctional diguanylate cyclase/phosphodiesterase [Treponemataceae bacterium]|nr:bifunctional diguanylate cyclase/phosphodiesterase [Treponemataceae bacterium]